MRTWQEETVVYNDLSGDTHLLGAPATTLLTLLRAGRASSAVLGAALCSAFALTPGEELDGDLDELLGQLRSFGLVDGPCWVRPC